MMQRREFLKQLVLTALVMALANSGKHGAAAGASLRNSLLQLAIPTTAACKEMEKLGIVSQSQD